MKGDETKGGDGLEITGDSMNERDRERETGTPEEVLSRDAPIEASGEMEEEMVMVMVTEVKAKQAVSGSEGS